MYVYIGLALPHGFSPLSEGLCCLILYVSLPSLGESSIFDVCSVSGSLSRLSASVVFLESYSYISASKEFWKGFWKVKQAEVGSML